MLTKKRCDELFEYQDGFLYRKQKTHGALIGEIAGNQRKDKYFHVRVDGKRQLWHRIIFVMHFGWEPETVDHIDGNPSNNKIENLRAATRSQNQHNRRQNKNCSSGIKGVSLVSNGLWCARLNVKRQTVFKQFFDDFELAQFAIEEARCKYHGNFAKHI
jgi:hypothetical protein